jgi:hypothetical protein
MLITKEQQEALLDKYMQENHNTYECSGFIDGMNALFELISNIEKRNSVVVEKSLDWALYI